MALMTAGVNNCYLVEPHVGHDQGDLSNGLILNQDASCIESGGYIEKGKRRQEGDGSAKAPKRLRLDPIRKGYTQPRAASSCRDSTIAIRPEAALSPSNSASPPTPSLALFRQSPRPPAKKYTRPPTKKVFESLNLSPEEWVRLEGEAKAYMLDTGYPERQACVGNRTSGPTNDTKINLYKTVQKFLESKIGARFFDASLDGGGDLKERWVYPRDETALISLLTPLMRRMVTNERQRQYARRTRATLQEVQSRNRLPPRHNADNHFPAVSVDKPEHPSSDLMMEVFYLSHETKLFHRHALEDVLLDFAKLHEYVLAECSQRRWAGSMQNLKIHVHGPYKLQVVDGSNWNTVRDEIRGAAWTAEGPIKVVVQCD